MARNIERNDMDIITPAFLVYYMGVAWLCSIADAKRDVIGENDRKKMYFAALGWPFIFFISMLVQLLKRKEE